VVPPVEFVGVENHVVHRLRVERFLDFRIRRDAHVREHEQEKEAIEELVRKKTTHIFFFCACVRVCSRARACGRTRKVVVMNSEGFVFTN
jgi:hypothetical protein